MNKRIEKYLDKSKEYLNLIHTPVHPNLNIFVVIPAYHESHIEDTLNSLQSCEIGALTIEVLLVINDAKDSKEEVKAVNLSNYKRLLKFQFSSAPRLSFHIAYAKGLPSKTSGVGYARKIGLDEGAARFAAIDKTNGILLCLDADCTVQPNYFQEVYRAFKHTSNKEAASIYFEHQDENKSIFGFGLSYELHLRYFIEMQRWLKLPFAYQTIGSAMATTAEAYAKEGGMVKRKAGEDFYFLHKFIRKHSCFEINSTVVYPSTRASDRVPFGTGKAIATAEEFGFMKTYNIHSFLALQPFLDLVPQLYSHKLQKSNSMIEHIHSGVLEFFYLQKVEDKIAEIKGNVATSDQFISRFFRWLDAFLFMKYLHFMRDYFFKDQIVLAEVKKGIKLMVNAEAEDWEEKEVLDWYRRRARDNPNEY